MIQMLKDNWIDIEVTFFLIGLGLAVIIGLFYIYCRFKQRKK